MLDGLGVEISKSQGSPGRVKDESQENGASEKNEFIDWN